MALTAFPTLNASLSEDKKCLLQHPSHNIGVAMDTAKGLLVPCISSVEEMSVLDIAEVRLSSTLLLPLLPVAACCCVISWCPSCILLVNAAIADDADSPCMGCSLVVVSVQCLLFSRN